MGQAHRRNPPRKLLKGHHDNGPAPPPAAKSQSKGKGGPRPVPPAQPERTDTPHGNHVPATKLSQSVKASWVTVQPKKRELVFKLDPAEWSVPEVQDLQPGTPGVKFCEDTAIAAEQLRRVKETSAPAALVVKHQMPGRSDHEPIVFKVHRTENGKTRDCAMWGFLYNVGTGKVGHQPKMEEVKLAGSGGTCAVLVEASALFTSPANWEALTNGKLHVMRKLVFDACSDNADNLHRNDVIDVFKLSKAGTSIVSAVVRIKTDALDRCLATSGKHGVFFRPLGARTDDFRITWLKGEQAKDLQQAGTLSADCQPQGAIGLAIRPNGLGIRSSKENFDKVRAVLGRDPSQNRWIISNISWTCSDTDVQEMLRTVNWEATPLHALRSRGGPQSSASWVVSSSSEPPKSMWRVNQPTGETFVVTVEKQQAKRPVLKTWGKNRRGLLRCRQ